MYGGKRSFQFLRKVSIVSEDVILIDQWMQLTVLLQQQFYCVTGRRMLAKQVWPIQFSNRSDFCCVGQDNERKSFSKSLDPRTLATKGLFRQNARPTKVV